MKKLSLLKTVLLLCALIVGSSNVWADDVVTTYTFTNRDWNATCDDEAANWTCNTRGSGYTAGQGTQVTTSGSGANATSPKSFTNVKKITITYCTNNKSGVGNIKVKVGGGTEQSFSVSAPSSGGTTLKTHDFSFSPTETGSVLLTVTCTTNSLYIYSIAITEEGSSDPSSSVAFENATPSLDFKNADTFTQTATTADGYSSTDGASVTYTITANTAGATIDANTGEVTPTTTGSVTVKATAAAIAGHFSQSTATYTLTVSDTRDEADLAYAEDEYDVYVGDVLSAPTLTNSHSLDVTYSSDDVTIATVDASGNVTGVKKGSTTITATFDGNRTYKPGSASYTINVAKAIPAGALFYESLSGYTGSSDNGTALSTNSANLDSENWNSFSYVYPGKVISGDSDGHLKFGSSNNAGTAVTKSLSLSGNGKLTYKVQRYDSNNTGNLTITVTGATATGDVGVTGTASWVEKNVFLTGATGSVVITFATSSSKRIRVDDITVTEVTSIPVTISSASGFATLFTPYPLNFATLSSELKAYTATVSENTVTLTPVENVPANTGVVLKGDVKTHNVPVIASSSTGKGSLEGSATEAMAYNGKSGYDLYMLALDGEGKAQFTKVTSGSIAAGKAYLPIATGDAARELTVVFDEGETTGIRSIENGKMTIDNYYNLNGQRVAQPTKGLYIMNGKKVIVK